ncbi:MAG: CPBP family intramembrane glutamic endopeptidase [Candidatus Bathyarchaeia archaeon]|jgi:membrane protease YdiL (CAAX protease family)
MKFSKFQLTIISLILAAALWTIVFLIHPYDFWTSLSLATALLLILSLAINGENPKIIYGKLSIRMILYGVISGLLLYGLFYVGFEIIKSTSFLLQGVNSVYGFRSTKPAYMIALLLIFPIAPGEETYWRGLVQRRLTERVGPRAGLLLSASVYSMVHLPTLNPTLILTAFIGGLVWGALYELTGNLVPVIISHTLWDILIFVILPLA